ncbi:MAG: MFS transporter [Chloroflexi bacterium]|nr:MFS transporter [Chloroflexota bacterium]
MSARRNFYLGVANGAAFQLADTLSDSTLVMVAFVAHLAVSPILIGLVVPLRNAGWYLPQLWVSGLVQNWRRKLPLYGRMAVLRAALWITLVSSVFWLTDRLWLLVVVFVCFAATELLAGVSGLSFLSIVGKVIPPRERGDFFAWRLTLGGLLGIGGGLLVKAVLDAHSPFAFPQNFGLLFGLTAICALIGMLAFVVVDEPDDEHLVPGASLRDQIRRARAVLASDENYRRFVRMRSALMIASAATPFFAVFAGQTFGVSSGAIGLYLATYTAAGLAANLGIARVSRRLGNRRTMALAGLAGLVMVSIVLAVAFFAAPLGLSTGMIGAALVVVFAFSGMREAGIGVAAQSLLLDLAPPGERPLYVGFTHSLLGVIILLTAASGFIVSAVGYVMLFVIALLANGFALWQALRMREPGTTFTPSPSLGLEQPTSAEGRIDLRLSRREVPSGEAGGG